MPQPVEGDEKLASEYEQFMKMVCTEDMPLPAVTDVAKECSPKKNLIKSASPHSYHEFNIESNLSEDNTNIEIQLKKFEKNNKQIREGSIKSTECEESILSIDSQVQTIANNMQGEYSNNVESEESKSIPSDWENVRIKVERLSDENIESREMKKKKKRKKVVSSSDSSSSASSSDSEKEKKRKKRKRKMPSDSSSSDSDSSDSSSSSSSDSSSDERRKRKRKKKKVGKKRKKTKRIKARMKKKRRRKMSTDSSSSDSDERSKKKKKLKKKAKEAKQFDVKSINNGDMSKIISKSPVIASSLDETSLQSMSPKKIKEEIAIEDAKRADQVISTRKSADARDNECAKRKEDRKEGKSDKGFIEQWEVDSTSTTQQNDGDRSSQDNSEEMGKIDSLQKDKHRKKRKHSRDNADEDKSKTSEERGKERSDEELETKRKKRREKDIKSTTEFLTDWERESELITQQIMQTEAKLSKKSGKQKKEKWGETDFDTLNVPSLTQLEKEVCRKQILADEWEVDSLEAIPDLTLSKRKSSQATSKKVEKQVRYDKKTDTYIAIEKESARESKKRQERLCAIRIWEEEQEEGEKEEMMLLEQKNKRKSDDWDIEEESFLRKNDEEIEISNVDNIIGIEEDASVKENSNKLMMALESTGSKRVRKSRWDMGSQSEEKLENKDIWEEYNEWPKIEKCEPKLETTEKGELLAADYSESSAKSNLIDFYHRKSQSRESLDRTWTPEEVASKSVQAKKVEDTSGKNLISMKTNDEQIIPAKEHQERDKFKEMLGLDTKFKEKTMELYSPSSPALSQKSQVNISFVRKLNEKYISL